jgi:hypothetical protein
MSSVAVGPAGPSDLDDAWAVVSEYYEAVEVEVREDRPAFSSTYFNDRSRVWSARSGDATVGRIARQPLDAFLYSGEIKRLCVHPSCAARASPDCSQRPGGACETAGYK